MRFRKTGKFVVLEDLKDDYVNTLNSEFRGWAYIRNSMDSSMNVVYHILGYYYYSDTLGVRIDKFCSIRESLKGNHVPENFIEESLNLFIKEKQQTNEDLDRKDIIYELEEIKEDLPGAGKFRLWKNGKFVKENIKTMRRIKLFENFDQMDDLKKFLEKNYPKQWWDMELLERVHDYIDMEDVVGSGEEEDPSTWDYEDEVDAYKNLSTGGAIEYDLLGIIMKDICDEFDITKDEYFNNDISDIVQKHMRDTIEWYDKFVFGDMRDKLFGKRIDTSWGKELGLEL